MNKEIGYVWQGTFLVLVILAGMWIVNVLASIEQPSELTGGDMDGGVAIVENASMHYSDEAAKGKLLFDNNCATCHKVTKDLTGPALQGIENRVKDKKLLYNWIRNNPAVLKTGNAYFTGLYNKWNQTPMNVFPNLTDEEVAAILSYIREYKVAATAMP